MQIDPPVAFVGRHDARATLEEAYERAESSLVAVVGRRRIGKTFLVRRVYGNRLRFDVTGIAGASLASQLKSFELQLEAAFGREPSSEPFADWLAALAELGRLLDPQLKGNPERRVIFFDELPWLASRRSGFLEAFGWFWNSWALQRRVTVVICGSAGEWMARKVVRDRGSLHNRITHRITLKAFTLAEADEYLDATGRVNDRFQRLQLYMTLGGVPFYLQQVQRGETFTLAIQRLLFEEGAPLREEFQQLYASLFEKPERHEAVVRYLAAYASGLTRTRLLEGLGWTSGGVLTKVLEELELSGFLQRSRPFGGKTHGALYRLTDEFTGFHLKFVETQSAGPELFQRIVTVRSYQSWAGFAFERVCLKHVTAIRKSLSILGVATQPGTYLAKGDEVAGGVQIDLLLDRADRAITLVEAKFSEVPFVITKAYASELRENISRFRMHSGTNKQLFLAVVSPYGLRQNTHSAGLVDAVVDMNALFADTR